MTLKKGIPYDSAKYYIMNWLEKIAAANYYPRKNYKTWSEPERLNPTKPVSFFEHNGQKMHIIDGFSGDSHSSIGFPYDETMNSLCLGRVVREKSISMALDPDNIRQEILKKILNDLYAEFGALKTRIEFYGDIYSPEGALEAVAEHDRLIAYRTDRSKWVTPGDKNATIHGVYNEWIKKAMGLYEDIEEAGPQPNTSMYDTNVWDKRRDFAKNYSWAVPDRNAIEQIKRFVGNERILEIGSGTGVWAKLIQDAGISITPTDLSPGETLNINNKKRTRTPTHTDIQELSHQQAIKQFGDHSVLMLCWPLYDHPMAYEALKAFRGNKLIYIGEGYGGCTGDEKFCNLLERKWTMTQRVEIPRWTGIYDSVQLHIRK